MIFEETNNNQEPVQMSPQQDVPQPQVVQLGNSPDQPSHQAQAQGPPNDNQSQQQIPQSPSKTLKETVMDFLSQHKIIESLPDNAQIIVLNSQLTLDQCIEAMVVEQSASFSLIWDAADRRSFTGIVTLRNVLEMLVSLCETIEQVTYENMRCASEDSKDHQAQPVLDEMQVVDRFLSRNPVMSSCNSQESLHSALDNADTIEHKMHDSESVGRGHYFGGGIARSRFNSHDSRGLAQGAGGTGQHGANVGGGFNQTYANFGLDFSLLPKILQSITLLQWQSSKVGRRTFSRSKIVDVIGLEDSLADGLNTMHENVNSFSMLALANKERTQIQAFFQTHDVVKYMVKNYDGDLSPFKRAKIDSYQHQTLVRSFKDDLLIELLFQMKQKRISILPVEDFLPCHANQPDAPSFTVGLVFLTDLLFLLRLPNFWELLSQPVSVFLEELYGNEQDLSRELQGSIDQPILTGQISSGQNQQVPVASNTGQNATQEQPGVGQAHDSQNHENATIGVDSESRRFSQDIDQIFGDDAAGGSGVNVFDTDFVDNQMEEDQAQTPSTTNVTDMITSPNQQAEETKAELDQLPTVQLDPTLPLGSITTTKYQSVDELIGKIEGIERTILIDKDNDTLLNIVEKIALIPDTKLVLVEPIYIPCPPDHQFCNTAQNSGLNQPQQSKVSYATRPKVKGVLSLPDVFTKLLSNHMV